MVFPVVMYRYESWTIKKAEHWRIILLNCGATEDCPLESREIKLVSPKGNQPWIFMGRTDAEVEAPILRPPDVKSQLTEKDPDAEKDWGQEEKGVTENEMFGWHHQFNGCEFEQTLGDTEGQRSLACCSPWVTKSWTPLSYQTTNTVI